MTSSAEKKSRRSQTRKKPGIWRKIPTPEERKAWRAAGVPDEVILPGIIGPGCYYDAEAAERTVRFFARILVHTDGRMWAGKPFILEDWQANEIIRPLFGMMRPDGTRMYRIGYIEIPRKNGKSPLAGGVALKLLVDDGEPGAKVYGAAQDRDQASQVFNYAADMVRLSYPLDKILRLRIIDSRKRIFHDASRSEYRAIPADAAGAHGFNSSGWVFDEFHTQKTRDLFDVLRTGGGAREQPLGVIITTAGFDRTSICWEIHNKATKIYRGIIEDPSFFCFLRGIKAQDELDSDEEAADWLDEEIWHLVNPALRTFRKLDEMRDEARAAIDLPAQQLSFRQLYLCEWTSSDSRFLPMDRWDKCDREVVEEDLEGRTAYGGLDLASVDDIAAWILYFPGEDPGDVGDVVCRFFVPKENIRLRSERDGVNYALWEKKGLIIPTPGNRIDFGYIKQKIFEDGERFNIKEIAFDRWGAEQITQELDAEGFTVVPAGQGYKDMSSPTKELLGLVLAGQLAHGGNPVLRWMADNLVVRRDPAENYKPDKEKSQEKIDGIVALIMAIGRSIRHKDTTSVYETRGIREV